MSLTTAQRAEQNRANAARSTGPRSDSGKLRSRTNALKHGLRAEALAMPGEDPAFAAARSREWHDHYRPQSPAARHLVDECVRASLLSERVADLQAAAAAERFEKATAERDAAKAGAFAALIDRFPAEPAAVRAALGATAAGCRWLIRQWEALASGPDGWYRRDAENAVLMLGGADHPDARAFDLLTGGPEPRRPRGPETDTATAFARIAAVVAAQLAALRADATRLADAEAAAPPEPAIDGALCLLPADESLARLYLRYQSEARTAFLRAWQALVAVLRADALEARREDAEEAVSPKEAEAPPAAPPIEASPVVVAARKTPVATAPAAAPRSETHRTALDANGRPTNVVNMCMVPHR